jgi:2-phospho-L-lactate guanylyltransferase (CobY/MobA/RfbA family)
MTADERTIANAALGAGPWDNQDQIVIAVADLLGLEPQHVEAVLQRLRIRMVLVCVSAARAGSEGASVRYERGMDWTDGE